MHELLDFFFRKRLLQGSDELSNQRERLIGVDGRRDRLDKKSPFAAKPKMKAKLVQRGFIGKEERFFFYRDIEDFGDEKTLTDGLCLLHPRVIGNAHQGRREVDENEPFGHRWKEGVFEKGHGIDK